MKHCLIIDNNTPTKEIKALEENGDPSFPVKCHYFNPTEKQYQRFEKINGSPELVIDLDLVLKALQDRFDGKQSIDLIASDYKLDDKITDGLKLLQFLKESWRSKVPTIVYSTDSDEIREKLKVEIEKIISDKNKLVEFLEDYYDHHPDQTIDRNEFATEIISYLKKHKSSMTNKLMEKLLEYPDKEFENIFPQFKGFKLRSLAKLIQKDSLESEVFKTEFLERSVAHFIFLKE